MKYDSHASLLARTFASLCLGREPKVRVATSLALKIFASNVGICNQPCKTISLPYYHFLKFVMKYFLSFVALVFKFF